ncbi:hypothetical protein BSM4216_2173 [Bacillus smithii]|nr:hypothetical protein BSM4216_2173 [Bacillus smithii]
MKLQLLKPSEETSKGFYLNYEELKLRIFGTIFASPSKFLS